MAESALTGEVDRLVRELSRIVEAAGCTVCTAESLTGGQLASALSSAAGAGQWYRGGIVAYHPEVKYVLLGSPRGPVVTAATARAMAASTRRLLDADFSVALTGVGGPGPEEGEPPGTVYVGSQARGTEPRAARHRFDGDPVAVLEQSIVAALRTLLDGIRRGGSGAHGS